MSDLGFVHNPRRRAHTTVFSKGRRFCTTPSGLYHSRCSFGQSRRRSGPASGNGLQRLPFCPFSEKGPKGPKGQKRPMPTSAGATRARGPTLRRAAARERRASPRGTNVSCIKPENLTQAPLIMGNLPAGRQGCPCHFSGQHTSLCLMKLLGFLCTSRWVRHYC